MFPTNQSLQKGVREFILLCLDLELFATIKRPDFYILVLYIFINNSRSKQNKKSRTPFCRHCQVENVRKISVKNIKLYGSWSSSRFSIFQTKNLAIRK